MADTEHNMMVGKGGEFAVASELLFNDFNANILTVDSGVDIAAIKNGQTYLFQVKTKHWNKRNQIVIDLELMKLEQFLQKKLMFLIIVGRYRNDPRKTDYLIFPIKDIKQFSPKLPSIINRRKRETIRLSFIKKKDNGITLTRIGAVTRYLDAWHLIG